MAGEGGGGRSGSPAPGWTQNESWACLVSRRENCQLKRCHIALLAGFTGFTSLEQRERWKYGRNDGSTDGRKDGRTDGRTDKRTNGRTNGQTDGRTDGRTDARTDGRTDEHAPLLRSLWTHGYPTRVEACWRTVLSNSLFCCTQRIACPPACHSLPPAGTQPQIRSPSTVGRSVGRRQQATLLATYNEMRRTDQPQSALFGGVAERDFLI